MSYLPGHDAWLMRGFDEHWGEPDPAELDAQYCLVEDYFKNGGDHCVECRHRTQSHGEDFCNILEVGAAPSECPVFSALWKKESSNA